MLSVGSPFVKNNTTVFTPAPKNVPPGQSNTVCKLQASYTDSDNSWSVATNELDSSTCDLSVKNPNTKEEEPLREPQAIIKEIIALDKESEVIMNSIRGMLR